MDSTPTIGPPILLALLAAGSFIGADRIQQPTWLAGFLLIAGIIFALASAITGLDYIIYRFASRLYSIRQAMALSERTELLRLASRLDGYQVELIMSTHGPIQYELEPAQIPQVFIRGAYPATLDFAEDFMSRSTDLHTTPIRTWSDGSHDRDMAKALTAFLIHKGRAKPAAGNRPATWTMPRSIIATWLGLEPIKDIANASH